MQQLKPSEISELIRNQIQKLTLTADFRTQGTVVTVTDGICRIHGLADVSQGEMLELRIQGHEVAEIAKQLGRSKRTVERNLQEVRAHLRNFLDLPDLDNANDPDESNRSTPSDPG